MKDTEKQPYIGIGTPVVNYHMTHRIFADGTVLEIMDHKILDSVAMGYYGGIQYQQKANTFGGGVYRYLPGTKNLQISDPSRVDIARARRYNNRFLTSHTKPLAVGGLWIIDVQLLRRGGGERT